MTTPELKVGDIVDISIKGVRVADVNRYGTGEPYSLRFLQQETRSGTIWIVGPGVTVEHVAPAEWPPQIGDLWRDRHATVYFAADVHDIAETDEPEILLICAFEGYQVTPDNANRTAGPLTLVHRERQDGGAL